MSDILKLKAEITSGASQDEKNRKVHEIIRDKSYPLDERWDLYELAVSENYLVEVDGYYFLPGHLSELEDVGFYGENRHGTYGWWDILEDRDYTDEEIIVIKEDILKDGSSEWTYDW